MYIKCQIVRQMRSSAYKYVPLTGWYWTNQADTTWYQADDRDTDINEITWKGWGGGGTVGQNVDFSKGAIMMLKIYK